MNSKIDNYQNIYRVIQNSTYKLSKEEESPKSRIIWEYMAGNPNKINRRINEDAEMTSLISGKILILVILYTRTVRLQVKVPNKCSKLISPTVMHT